MENLTPKNLAKLLKFSIKQRESVNETWRRFYALYGAHHRPNAVKTFEAELIFMYDSRRNRVRIVKNADNVEAEECMYVLLQICQTSCSAIGPYVWTKLEDLGLHLYNIQMVQELKLTDYRLRCSFYVCVLGQLVTYSFFHCIDQR